MIRGPSCNDKKTARPALRIAVIYLLSGCLWIPAFDLLTAYLSGNAKTLVFTSIIKGWAFVVASALLLFWLVRRAMNEAAAAHAKLSETNQQLQRSRDEYYHLYQEFAEKQLLHQAMIRAIPDLVFWKDAKGVYRGCNQAAEQLLDLSEEELIGRTDRDLFTPEISELFSASEQEILQTGQSREDEWSVIRPDGQVAWYHTIKTPYWDARGEIAGLVGISRDITRRRQHEDEIRYLNYHDALTGLYNRTFFEEELKRLDTPRQLPLSIIAGDINGLKLINDALGHDEGDKLLIQVAQILRSNCRAEDIVARTGGDEFWILLPETDEAGAREIVKRIRTACTGYARRQENAPSFIDISLGYATKGRPTESFSKIRNYAENDMYKRKLRESRELHRSIIQSIRETLFEKSFESYEHTERLGAIALQIAEKLGLSPEEKNALKQLSELHDVGKIGIDRQILTKESRLTPEEWAEIRKHPEVGFRIAQASPELRPIAELILTHHERWDGKGYPQGLAGEKIPLLSRILAVADAYESMTAGRPYKPGMSREQAAAEIRRQAGTQFDPAIVRQFLGILEES